MEYSENCNPTYENFEAECPHCRHWNIYNRISDIGHLDGIDHHIVSCSSCGREFGINGDLVETNHLRLVEDARVMFREKKYSICIILLTTAMEAFFFHHLYVVYLFLPFRRRQKEIIQHPNYDDDFLGEEERLIKSFEEISLIFNKKIERSAFTPMRQLFLICISNDTVINNLEESKDYIAKLKMNELGNVKLKFTDLDVKLLEPIQKIRNCKIDDLRNGIVHKYVNLPNKQETQEYLQTVSEVLYGLQSYFLEKYRDDIWYVDIWYPCLSF